MNDRILDVPLTVYTPTTGFRGQYYNVWVVLVYQDHFKTISSRKAASILVADKVTRSQLRDRYRPVAVALTDASAFLMELIGTTDRRTKDYKEFVEQVNEYKAWVMEQKLKEK